MSPGQSTYLRGLFQCLLRLAALSFIRDRVFAHTEVIVALALLDLEPARAPRPAIRSVCCAASS